MAPLSPLATPMILIKNASVALAAGKVFQERQETFLRMKQWVTWK